MGLFGTSSTSALEAEIEKATSEKNISEKWGMIMDICDKIGSSSSEAKDSLRIILKRLNHPDPHVVVQAITLLDACVSNCGKNYHLEIASREFETEYKRLIQKSQPPVAAKLKACLKKWAEGDFKKDPQLNLIPSMYNKLKQEGHDFSDPDATPKREVQLSKDPNVVSSQQEEDDILKAIELSLKDKTSSTKTQTSTYSSSLYPSMNMSSTSTGATSGSASAPAPEPRKVRALYDFEAAEDNELTFKAGEIIMVIEESDPNWWRGSNHRGEGFFPANFVTADLSAEPEELSKETKTSSKKSDQVKEESQNVQNQQPVEINEEAIDRLLFLLHEADPSDPSQDSQEMLRLENVVNQMGPLIDSELERVDRKHAQLTQLSSDLIDTINLYHSLMRETERAPSMNPYSGFQHNQMFGGVPGVGYPQNTYGMPPGSMMPPGMMMGMPGHGPVHPQTSSASQNNFPMSQVSGNFPHPGQNSMIPPNSQQNMMNQPITNGQPQTIQHPQQQQQGNIQQMPQQQMQTQNMMLQMPNGSQQMMPSGQHLQQIQSSGQSFPSQQQPSSITTVAPQQHPQQNGIPPQNYQMNPMSLPHPNMQLNQMMGNMTLQSPPSSMQNLHQMTQQQGPGMQITQPMTFNLQADSNQNIPVYQQQR